MDYAGDTFNDPIVRCDQCSKLTHRDFLRKTAGCCHCGNKRFKNVLGFEEKELLNLKAGTLVIGKKNYTIDPDFLALFEVVKEVE